MLEFQFHPDPDIERFASPREQRNYRISWELPVALVLWMIVWPGYGMRSTSVYWTVERLEILVASIPLAAAALGLSFSVVRNGHSRPFTRVLAWILLLWITGTLGSFYWDLWPSVS